MEDLNNALDRLSLADRFQFAICLRDSNGQQLAFLHCQLYADSSTQNYFISASDSKTRSTLLPQRGDGCSYSLLTRRLNTSQWKSLFICNCSSEGSLTRVLRCIEKQQIHSLKSWSFHAEESTRVTVEVLCSTVDSSEARFAQLVIQTTHASLVRMIRSTCVQ